MSTGEYVSIDEQIRELEERYKYKTMLSVRDLQDIFGWSRSGTYSKIEEGVFLPFGDIPKDAKRIHKKIAFQYFRSLFSLNTGKD